MTAPILASRAHPRAEASSLKDKSRCRSVATFLGASHCGRSSLCTSLLKKLLHLWPASGSNELLQALFHRSPVSRELESHSGAHVKALSPLGGGGCLTPSVQAAHFPRETEKQSA